MSHRLNNRFNGSNLNSPIQASSLSIQERSNSNNGSSLPTQDSNLIQGNSLSIPIQDP